jgi:hypothetical protein
MTHRGSTLDHLIPLLKNARKRTDFAADMLRQIIMASKPSMASAIATAA